MDKQLTTPVAIIVFKRLAATKQMFATVRAAQPTKLFVIADGWRSKEERVQCEEVRTYIEDSVDWPCEVHTNYAAENLGLRKRVVTGLNWVFEQVESAIVLEDDCIPDMTFYRFCEELLERYKDEPRVMQIAAMNVQGKNPRFTTHGESYYYSQFGEIWGWATWRRAWQLYDEHMAAWPKTKRTGLLHTRLTDEAVIDHLEYRFDFVHAAGEDRSKSNVWGAQWIFTQLLHNGLSIVPATNLITNIGDTEGTHVKGSGEFHHMNTIPLTFPLVHPKGFAVNKEADHWSLHVSSGIKATFAAKVLFFMKRNLPGIHALLKKLK